MDNNFEKYLRDNLYDIDAKKMERIVARVVRKHEALIEIAMKWNIKLKT